MSGFKSDGGSSDYYKIYLPVALIQRIQETGYVEVKDVLRYGLDNDATLFNVGKALFRIASARRGLGKSGVTEDYDLNKCAFFIKDEMEALNDLKSGFINVENKVDVQSSHDSIEDKVPTRKSSHLHGVVNMGHVGGDIGVVVGGGSL